MSRKYLNILLLILLNAFFVLAVSAQTLEGCEYIDNMPGEKPMSPHLRKRMIKLCIESKKKEYEKLIANSEEVAKLSNEIERSFEENKKLSSSDQKKLKRVEKLLKQIRKELRANDEDDDDDKEKKEKPSSTLEAIKDLREKTTNLLSEVKKTTRHTISTAAIQSSNAVLKIIKFLRFKN